MKLTAILCLLSFTVATVFSAPAARAASNGNSGQLKASQFAAAPASKPADDVAAAKNDKPKKSKKDKDSKDGDPDDGNAGHGNDGKTLPHDGPAND